MAKKNHLAKYVALLILCLNHALIFPLSYQQNDIQLHITNYANVPYDPVFNTLSDVLVKQFEVKGYYPIRISVSNRSGRAVVLSPQLITLPLIRVSEVADEVHDSGDPLFGLKIGGAAGLISLILCLTNRVSAHSHTSIPIGPARVGISHHAHHDFNNPLRNYLQHFLVSSALLGIGSQLYKWYTTSRKNNAIYQCIKEQSLRKDIIIYPGRQESRLIFVRTKSYYDSDRKFSIDLHDWDNTANKTSFNVDLNQKD